MKTVSNSIDSGGRAPRQYGDAYERKNPGNRSSAQLLRTAGAMALLALVSELGHARDRGQFAGTSPELKAWFEGLRSGKGPCCSDADGTAISDADWESKDGHYRVRVPRYGYVGDGQQQEVVWVEVPEEAVISEPNRVGRTMVWPIYGYLGVTIRCFMPGSMT